MEWDWYRVYSSYLSTKIETENGSRVLDDLNNLIIGEVIHTKQKDTGTLDRYYNPFTFCPEELFVPSWIKPPVINYELENPSFIIPLGKFRPYLTTIVITQFFRKIPNVSIYLRPKVILNIRLRIDD